MRLIFEWDEEKYQVNSKKHKITFDEAKTIFNDPFHVTYSDVYHSVWENRFISIGVSASSRTLLVVHTENEQDEDRVVIRIISARKATDLERESYEENKT